MQDEPKAHAEAMAPEPFDRLTVSERAVVRALVNGKYNAEVAKARGCTVATVAMHRSSALKKLRLRNNVELTREAIRVGFTTLDGVQIGLVYDAVKDAWREPARVQDAGVLWDRGLL